MDGKVKRFNELRGYGFITGEDGEDYFFHYSMIISDGFKTLNVDDQVAFTPKITFKGLQAIDVKLCNDMLSTQLKLKNQPSYYIRPNYS
jgi:CspA family cold shock protein